MQDRYQVARAAIYRRRGTGWVIVFRPSSQSARIRVLSGSYPNLSAALAAADRLNAADDATRPEQLGRKGEDR